MIGLKGVRATLALALIAIFAWTGAAIAAPKFPPLSGRVVDGANLISASVEQQLTDELAQLEASTGRQLVVVTLPSLQGYEIEDFGYQLGRAWGIGDETRDDGVLFIVAPNERKVRIEVGYGLEPVLTDALSSVIIQSQVLPAFKQDQYETGIAAGTRAIVRQLGLPDDQARAQAAQAAQPAQRSEGGGVVPAIVVFLIIFWVLGGLFGGGRRRRGRGGGGAWWLLPLLINSGGGRGGGWSSGGGGGWGGGGGGSFGGGGSSGSW